MWHRAAGKLEELAASSYATSAYQLALSKPADASTVGHKRISEGVGFGLSQQHLRY
jgi:hypothetical protein